MLLLSLLSTLAAAAPSAPGTRAFECVQITWTDPGTEVVVTGSVIPFRARPTAITVSSEATGAVFVTTAAPRLMNTYMGGYWYTNYALNTWTVGRYGTTSYVFLLPTTALGGAFDAQLHESFGPGGAWGWDPLEMDCVML